ncbi:hypothetical protein Hs30E_15090 [Lactococcus hodotermopsidis]|uniref:Glycosyl transferase n=1 Tax=Pseudolactococcus hodotermopsidis TaxID=2709157 RepID=A0A6A0BF39_9LACT|nr:glycosyltransferase [Lactococcus hodotermopsidis]GFH42958.1 hypothetical protein Hs30E_15090 [Lactococcus hodotermopsidis]
MSEKINIVSSGNSGYFALAPTFLTNFFEKHKNFDVTFYAFSDFIEEKYLRDMQKIADYYGQTFKFVEIAKDEFAYMSDYPNAIMMQNWPIQSYYLLLAGKYLPNNVERAMFFDFDVTFFDAIDDVYFTDFEDNYFIGVRDLISYRNDAILTDEEMRMGHHINTGAVILNIEKMRINQIDAQYFKLFVEELVALPPVMFGSHGIAFFADQGLLSYVFRQQIKTLKPGRIFHMVQMPEKNQAAIVHLLDPFHKSYKAELQDIFSADDYAYIYNYQRYKLKSQLILGNLSAVEVFELFDKPIRQGIQHMDFVLAPYNFNLPGWKRLESEYLTTYRLQQEGIRRLCFRLSKHFKKEQVAYRINLSVKSSEDVANFGLVGFLTNGKVTRLSELALKRDNIQTLSAEVDFGRQDLFGVGISSHSVPLGTKIDIVAISIEKMIR